MKECFKPKGFSQASLALIQTIDGILEEYRAAGYDLSLRQLYYQLVARDIVPNTERSYKNVGNLVSDARLAGLLDWDMIKDRGRLKVVNSHWNGPADILDTCAQQFRLDLWADQPIRVLVMVEKQALEGVLLPVCQEFDVPFMANKGYSSSSALYETGMELRRAYRETRRECVVVYLGDHDPSGIDMTRDVDERLAMFASYSVRVERIALNLAQVRELNPPENPAKVTDSRFEAYRRRFGDSSWELDAIEPTRLARLVTAAIERNIDWSRWDAATARQQQHRTELLATAEQFRSRPTATA